MCLLVLCSWHCMCMHPCLGCSGTGLVAQWSMCMKLASTPAPTWHDAAYIEERRHPTDNLQCNGSRGCCSWVLHGFRVLHRRAAQDSSCNDPVHLQSCAFCRTPSDGDKHTVTYREGAPVWLAYVAHHGAVSQHPDSHAHCAIPPALLSAGCQHCLVRGGKGLLDCLPCCL